MPEIENHADTDAGIGDVERGIDIGPDVHVQKVDHMSVNQPVSEIPGYPAAEETKTNLRRAISETERTTPDEDCDERRSGQ